MKFEQRCSIAAERERVWAFLMDIPQVGSCVPGVSQVRPLDGDRYQGSMTVRLGPINLTFDVHVTVETMDRAWWHAAMRAEGNDRWVGGSVGAAFQMQLEEMAPGLTALVIHTDLNVLGRLGQFGQPLIRKKADSILEEFAANVRERVGAGASVPDGR